MTATTIAERSVASVTAPAVGPGATAATDRGISRGFAQRLVRGRPEDPSWARPALLALLALTGALYFWNLTNSGYANEFYAAAVKSASQDWKAWLFGSLDSANAITVDKPPASLWVMGLSARIFGFSSFSLLAPQALMGVGTVGLLYGAVRRQAGHAFGLVAGLLAALTPVAALMFRFDNPDAMLTLLMTGAAYCVVRATETARGRTALRWMLGAGVAIGFAFLTKMLQGLLVLPALGLTYVIAARHCLKARLLNSVAALVAVVVSAGWFIALVSLWPATARAYIGGSTNNSLWELALGYNGLGRILGGSGNGGGGGGSNGNTGFGGTAGILRMFNAAFGGEISWLLPAALVLLVAGLVARGRAARTDAVRAGLVMWGGWLVVTAIVLSFMEGTVHPYYAIALVPGIAGTVAIGASELFARRASLAWRVVLAAAVSATACWSLYLLKQASYLVAGGWVALVITALGLMAWIALGADGFTDRAKRLGVIGLVVAATSSLFGTTAYTLATVSQGHNGSIPTSGPTASAMGGGAGGGQRMGTPPGGTSTGAGQGTRPGASSTTSGTSSSSTSSSGTSSSTTSGTTSTSTSTTTSTTSLTELLNSAGTTWSAATIGDQSAAGYILSSDTAVMSIGGWSGSDDNVTLAQFQQYVANGQIHYFLSGGQGGGPGGSNGSAAQITAWVKAHYTATTVGGVTVYDLTKATS